MRNKNIYRVIVISGIEVPWNKAGSLVVDTCHDRCDCIKCVYCWARGFAKFCLVEKFLPKHISPTYIYVNAEFILYFNTLWCICTVNCFIFTVFAFQVFQ